METAVFYHVWAPGFWEEPLAEFLRALDDAGFDGPLHVGIVGPSADRQRVLRSLPRPYVDHQIGSGNEAFTVNLVRWYAFGHDGAVIYAHTKGATTGYNQLQGPWRWLMTDAVVKCWRENLAVLDHCDAVGWAWLDERVPGASRCFIGNFWMARCDYLRTLPPCEVSEERGPAEGWIGLGGPRVAERVEWDREVGPPVLDQVWPILRERWNAASSR